MRWMMVLAALWATAGAAQDGTAPPAGDATGLIRPAGDATLAQYEWIKRPIVVFAESPADPRFVQQMQFIESDLTSLVERDVVVLTDTDPATLSPLRRELRPRGFMLVVIAKDGTIIQRKPLPWSVREISRAIDKMPMRQQEVRDQRATQEGS